MGRARPGYVYVIGEPSGTYKIGRAVNIEDRLRTHGVLLPFPITYTHVIRCYDMYEIEKYLHGRYAAKRVNGEWFALTPDDIETLQGVGSAENFQCFSGRVEKFVTRRMAKERLRRSFGLRSKS